MGILSASFNGLLWVLEEIRKREEEELYNEDAVKAELAELYARLESGSIQEEEFERRESELVERIERIRERQRNSEGEARPRARRKRQARSP